MNYDEPMGSALTKMRRRSFLLLSTSAAVGVLSACRKGEPGGDGSETTEAIGPSMTPAALAARLPEVAAGGIAVFYVGPGALFARGHVPGARNVGEMGTSEGRRALEAAVAKLPPEVEIVLYCGCCPVKNCPNVRPASAFIRASGRKNASVLDLPTRFAADWADKGYPVEKS